MRFDLNYKAYILYIALPVLEKYFVILKRSKIVD
jgi:hypothetical protein